MKRLLIIAVLSIVLGGCESNEDNYQDCVDLADRYVRLIIKSEGDEQAIKQLYEEYVARAEALNCPLLIDP